MLNFEVWSFFSYTFYMFSSSYIKHSRCLLPHLTNIIHCASAKLDMIFGTRAKSCYIPKASVVKALIMYAHWIRLYLGFQLSWLCDPRMHSKLQSKKTIEQGS